MKHKALLVDGEHPGYFLTVSGYIHLNPVRMKGAARVHTLKELLGARKDRPEWNLVGWKELGGRPQSAKTMETPSILKSMGDPFDDDEN